MNTRQPASRQPNLTHHQAARIAARWHAARAFDRASRRYYGAARYKDEYMAALFCDIVIGLDLGVAFPYRCANDCL